jgi:hypothetical protein
LRSILDARRRAIEQESTPVKVTHEPAIRREEQSKLLVRKQGLNSTVTDKADLANKPKSINPLVLFFGLFAIFSLVLFGAWRLIFGGTAATNPTMEEESTVANSTEQVPGVQVAGATLEEQGQTLEQYVESTDPLAHDSLVKVARGAASPELRDLAESKIIKRARKNSLVRAAEQVRAWLKRLDPNKPLPASYEPVLRSLDSQLPPEERGALLRRAYADDPSVALSLAAATALDSADTAAYQPLLAQLVGDSLHLDDAKQHSALALILAHPELTLVYGDDVVERINEIPDPDVLWALSSLARRSDTLVRDVAQVALERGLVSPIREKFLRLVGERKDLPPDVLVALVRSAGGVLEPGDLSSLGKWYDLEAVNVLITLMAELEDQTLLQEAFDNLAVKSFDIEPAAALVKWIRLNHWEERGSFAHAIGVIQYADLVDPGEVEKAVAVFDPYSKDRDLAIGLVRTKQPLVLRSVIQRYPDALGLAGLLRLLSNEDKDIRIMVVKALGKYNDVGALKLILDAYRAENNPEVKQAYRDTFWVIKEREEREVQRSKSLD